MCIAELQHELDVVGLIGEVVREMHHQKHGPDGIELRVRIQLIPRLHVDLHGSTAFSRFQTMAWADVKWPTHPLPWGG